MKPESGLRTKILDALNAMQYVKAEAVHGSLFGHQKLDIIGCANRFMFIIEVKMPGEEPTPRQYSTMNKWIKKSNCRVTWVDSVDSAKIFVRTILYEADLRFGKRG